MFIETILLEPAEIALKTRVGTSLGGNGISRGHIVKVVTSDGKSGIGWAHENAFIAGETFSTIASVIQEVILPYVKGKDPFDIQGIMEGIGKLLQFNYRAKSAVDMALHDLITKEMGIPLYKYLGGLSNHPIECIRMIGLKSPDEMAKEALQLKEQGFKNFKLKIDSKPDDVDRVKAVCDIVGKESKIVLDPNQAYSPKGIIQLMNRLHDCNIAILEQPVPVGDIDGLALVRRSVDVMVEADESIRTMDDAYRIIEKNAADIISLKVPKMGGIHWVRKIADLCESANIPCLMGGGVGSCILDIVQLHIASSHSNIKAFACEIGESQRLTKDVATGLDIRDGYAYVPEAPGIGAKLI